MIDFDVLSPADRQLVMAGRFGQRDQSCVRQPAEKREQRGRKPTQLELDFNVLGHLAKANGRLASFHFKPFRLNIGPRMTFEPDFVAIERMSDESTITYVIDIKGPWVDGDSRVKIKIGAEKFPLWEFYVITRENGIWCAKYVSETAGIGRKNENIPWIHGG